MRASTLAYSIPEGLGAEVEVRIVLGIIRITINEVIIMADIEEENKKVDTEAIEMTEICHLIHEDENMAIVIGILDLTKVRNEETIIEVAGEIIRTREENDMRQNVHNKGSKVVRMERMNYLKVQIIPLNWM
jgi:hypothetical protein